MKAHIYTKETNRVTYLYSHALVGVSANIVHKEISFYSVDMGSHVLKLTSDVPELLEWNIYLSILYTESVCIK